MTVSKAVATSVRHSYSKKQREVVSLKRRLDDVMRTGEIAEAEYLRHRWQVQVATVAELAAFLIEHHIPVPVFKESK